MARETVRDKAGRYLLEGRVVVERVTTHLVIATVRGEGRRYRVQWHPDHWTCSCPHQARTTDCSHITALKRITATDIEEMTP